MYPELHEQVLKQLRESGLAPDFHYEDDIVDCTETFDTSIMGKFRCSNNKCSTKWWSSKKIAITIRLYNDSEYNAIVYHQLCRDCKIPSTPSLDGSYAERISYRIKVWCGLDVPESIVPQNQTKSPHESALCLGCKNGHCREGGITRARGVSQIAGLCRFVLTIYISSGNFWMISSESWSRNIFPPCSCSGGLGAIQG